MSARNKKEIEIYIKHNFACFLKLKKQMITVIIRYHFPWLASVTHFKIDKFEVDELPVQCCSS